MAHQRTNERVTYPMLLFSEINKGAMGIQSPPKPASASTSPTTTSKQLPATLLDLITVPDRYKVKNTMEFEWVIKNWQDFKSQEKRYSEEFTMGDSRWRLMVFPNGNRTPDWISAFLECLDFQGILINRSTRK